MMTQTEFSGLVSKNEIQLLQGEYEVTDLEGMPLEASSYAEPDFEEEETKVQ